MEELEMSATLDGIELTIAKVTVKVPEKFGKHQRNKYAAFVLGVREAAKGGDWQQFNPFKRSGGSFDAFEGGGQAFDEARLGSK